MWETYGVQVVLGVGHQVVVFGDVRVGA